MASLSPEQLASIEQAAHWYSRLNDEDVTSAEREAWQRWLHAAPLHAWAWERAEQLMQQWRQLPGPMASHTLAQARQARTHNRRSVLKGLTLLIGAGSLSVGGYQQVVNGPWFADFRSAIGERLPVSLADGSQLLLNTDSAVDVRYDGMHCAITLRQGEIMVSPAPGVQLSVQTRHGLISTAASRFTVRDAGETTRVMTLERQVRISPAQGAAEEVGQGMSCLFDERGVRVTRALDYAASAWTRGLLIANDQPLGEFLEQLGRYNRGWLRCDPAVAALRISGTFELDNFEQILRALASSLPVRIEQRTRFWITVSPA
ncbi:FecR domain-containing protein [Pseudomonas sp. H9]|uniref:FecR domain-containing protein n=1 Tax=Pseudomonas sp. H9 TaxID=483968 RepID=UPI0014055A9A|nr:FecR domain-containing protein [Pseudomonas sp. H9]